MQADWLWDRTIPLVEVKAILRDEQNARFVELAALLLSRKNAPEEVFGRYLKKEIFVRNWARIKKKMRQNKWDDARIIFWQAVYEKLLGMLKTSGASIRVRGSGRIADEVCLQVGEKIRQARQQSGLTQQDFAKKLAISQQIISRLEQGKGNMSILTLKKIAHGLNKQLVIELK